MSSFNNIFIKDNIRKHSNESNFDPPNLQVSNLAAEKDVVFFRKQKEREEHDFDDISKHEIVR